MILIQQSQGQNDIQSGTQNSDDVEEAPDQINETINDVPVQF